MINKTISSKGMEVAERILGLGDRRPGSATVGCYDRMYWRYQLIDYPSSWFQSATEYLALLWDTPGSRFYQQKVLRRWFREACDFTCSNLNRDGSCVEVYPHERSFCATAFLLGHLCGALGISDDRECPEGLLKMGGFLSPCLGGKVSNQLAAAALGLFRLSRLTGEAEYLQAGEQKLAVLYDNQTAEGYFHEYGGLDVGYLTITLSLLARLETEFPGAVDGKRVRRAVAVLDRLVRENGTFDYRATSRQTQFLYPFGLYFWESPVKDRLAMGLKKKVIVVPIWLDDRYVTELAIDYLYLARWMSGGEKNADRTD